MKTPLHLVEKPCRPRSHQAEIDELRARMAELAREEREDWLTKLDALHESCMEVIGNPLHPVGIRDLARAVLRPIEQTSLNAEVILGRTTR